MFTKHFDASQTRSARRQQPITLAAQHHNDKRWIEA
jgi:hypothetical protein